MADLEKYQQMFDEALVSPEAWVDGPMVEFTEDLCRLMKEKNVSRADLAKKLGTSRAYVTKMLGGNANFTLATMVKLAFALDGAVHVHIADKWAVTRWHDEIPGEEEEVEEVEAEAATPKRSQQTRARKAKQRRAAT